MEAVTGKSVGIEITPVINTAAYTAGDQVGEKQELLNAAIAKNRLTTLQTLVITEKGTQKKALRIFFFNDNPATTSSNNDPFALSAAEVASKFVGHIDVAAADYVACGSASVVTISMANSGRSLKSAIDAGKLYAVAITTETPTYSSASDLTFKYSFGQDN